MLVTSAILDIDLCFSFDFLIMESENKNSNDENEKNGCSPVLKDESSPKSNDDHGLKRKFEAVLADCAPGPSKVESEPESLSKKICQNEADEADCEEEEDVCFKDYMTSQIEEEYQIIEHLGDFKDNECTYIHVII